MKTSNYELSRQRASEAFLKYDQAAMIQKFNLRADEDYLYITFFASEYRIGRFSGVVEGSDDGFATVVPGSFDESMSIYDVLCNAREDCHLTGDFVMTNSLPGIVYTTGSGVGDGMYREYARYFDQHRNELAQACARLHGTPEGKGDVAYRLPMFDFLPMRLEFWESDEEFPPEIRLYWDRNVQTYMRYETLWYAAGHLLRKLETMIGNGMKRRQANGVRPFEA